MAGSKSITVSRTIPAPPEAIWRVLNDTRRYAEWVPQTLEVTRSDGEGIVGATYDERNRVLGPIKGSSRWRVVEADARHSLHEGEGLPLVKNVSIEFTTQPVGDATEVTSTLRYDMNVGPLGPLFDKLGRGQNEREQAEALANLERLVTTEVAQATA